MKLPQYGPTPGKNPKPMPPEPDPLPENASLHDRIVHALKKVYDPEIPVDIYELGLIYGIDISDLASGGKRVHLRMTLTSPNCPEAQTLPQMAESYVRSVPGIEEVTVTIVWDPPWNRDMISDEAKLALGLI
jgi:FeS assembly SUF system protein